ncbi:UNVERIFIED_CONTAM: spore germination protein [Brevibacillus sp. OAP136]
MMKQLLLLITLAMITAGPSVPTQTEAAPSGPTAPTAVAPTAVPSKPVASPATAPVQSAAKPKKVLGYYVEYYDTDRNSYRSLSANADVITDVSLVSYDAKADGSLTGSPSATGLTTARAKSVDSYLLVANHGTETFDKKLVHTILNNPTATARLIDNLVAQAVKMKATGINLDFENIPADDRAKYTQLISQLSAKLHQNKKQLVVSVPAKLSDDPKETWTYAYDYRGIGSKADFLQVMSYDEYGPWMEAGPVASYPWVDSVLRFAASLVPGNKLLMGIPSYGYEWSAAGNKAVAYKAIPELIANQHAQVQWNDQLKSPYLTYQKDGVVHTLWFENEESLSAKRALADKYHLAGYGIWRLGLDDPSFWDALVR